MRTLEKDRARRYQSPAALAADLSRFLSFQPVEACRPSALYRLAKYLRRNRQRVAIAGALGVSLIVAAIFSGLSSYHQAREDAARAGKVREALAAARASMESRNPDEADRRLAEARAAINSGRRLGELAAEVSALAAEVHAHRDGQERFTKFMQLLDDAQSKMRFSEDLEGDRDAREALNLFHVVEDDAWRDHLDSFI